MIRQITLAFLPCRLAISSILAGGAVLGFPASAAMAADASSISCEEAAQVGPTPEGQQAAAHAGSKQGAAGFRAYVDPETGELTEPPEGAAPEEAPAAAFSTSEEGLVVEQHPEPGGGVMVDLQGRFRSPLVATVEADGKVKIKHVTCPGNSTQRK